MRGGEGKVQRVEREVDEGCITSWACVIMGEWSVDGFGDRDGVFFLVFKLWCCL